MSYRKAKTQTPPPVSEGEYFEQRNSLPNEQDPERNYAELVYELEGYLHHPDTSPLKEGQISDQGEVMEKVYAAVKTRHFRTALAILFSEDIKMTHQLSEIAIRLNRLDQLYNRESTSDSLEFSGAKDFLKNHTFEMLKYYKGQNKDRALFIVKNVANARAGTTEIGLSELEETRDMVQAALRQELKNKFQGVLPPHKMYGQEAEGVKDQNYVTQDISANITEYMRLFDALTIAIVRQKEITSGKDIHLQIERESALGGLDSLIEHPGVAVSLEQRNEFMDKLSTMNFDQLRYFELKAADLKDRLKSQKTKPEEAGREIGSWFEKKFSKEELHQEIEKLHKAGEEEKAKGLEEVRNKLAA